MNAKIITSLESLRACRSATEWVSQQKTPTQAWRECERADWMMWLIGKTCNAESDQHKRLVLLACRIASDALSRYWNRDDPRPREAIRMVRMWVRGHATIEQVRTAAYAAADADDDADADDADDAAAYAADAAARAKTMRRYANWVRKEFPNPPRIT